METLFTVTMKAWVPCGTSGAFGSAWPVRGKRRSRSNRFSTAARMDRAFFELSTRL